MSDSKREQEDLKRLEDQAYFELKQIIAEAMQYQSLELLDSKIDSWKNKYKKLLDRPSTSSKSDFKKRIEFLLNKYYLDITDYILNKLKLKEQKMVENQAKALRQLYRIIRDTNDYDLLKKKVSKWKEKYPVDGFLRMYQKRISYYTKDKSLKENAFNQEEAFSDLVNITKIHGTLDELNSAMEDWEEKYSINDKYTIDDFIKHQTEVKRYTSPEFLQSIAREDTKINNADKTDLDMVEEYNNKSFSDLSVQAKSYAALASISRSPNSINDMFKWVYENRHIKFNDKYKELILSATYLDYSPTYLNKLKIPDMDMSKNSLSYDEYKNITDIKRYAIISYFNLLLPPEKAISNDYFTKHIQTVYAKSERARTTSKMEDPSISLDDDVLTSGVEISLNNLDKTTYEDDNTITPNPIEEIKVDNYQKSEDVVDVPEEISDEVDTILEISDNHIELDTYNANSIDTIDESKKQETKLEDDIDLSKLKPVVEIPLNDTKKISTDEYEPKHIDTVIDDSSIQHKETKKDTVLEPSLEDTEESTDYEVLSKVDKSDILVVEDKIEPKHEEGTSGLDSKTVSLSISDDSETSKQYIEEDLDYSTIVALSPLFIAAVNNLDKQAVLVNHIDSTTTKYIESEKSNSLDLDSSVKYRNNID